VRAGLERHVADTLADEVMVISDTFNPVQRRASYTRLARAGPAPLASTAASG
jgi:hypothetical protein